MAKQENYGMAAAIIVAGIIIALGIAYSTALYSSSTSAPSAGTFVSISASGIAYGAPSQADLYVIMNGTGGTTALATANLSSTLEAFNSTIMPFVHGNRSLIGTGSYSVYKIYNKSGYIATETLTVSLPELSNASAAIGALSASPNIYIGSITPRLSDSQQTSLRSSALSSALGNATAQAEAIVPPGARLSVRNVSVDSYVIYPLFNSLSASSVRNASQPGPLIFGGIGKVVEHVSVIFSYH